MRTMCSRTCWPTMAELSLEEYAEDFRQEVVLRSSREDEETTSLEAFVEIMIDELSSAGVVDDGEPAPYKKRGVEASGYTISDDDTELTLLVAVHKQTVPPPTTTSDEIEKAIKRASAFIEEVHKGLVNSLEESTPAFDMALAIQEAIPTLRKVRILVITDGVAVLKDRPILEWRTRQVVTDVWDMRRLHQLAISGRPQEPIDVDFITLTGGAVPCLPSGRASADYRSVLAVFPAEVLVEIYDLFGGRLLERNVRAFLQARGKVNAGIRKTILEEPSRFLAYNNGISATASDVEIVEMESGGWGIARIHDLQIVNGGQTTASLHHLARRDRERAKVDLTEILVSAKLSIVAEEDLDEIVPLISRYANSQNKVNEADFEANSPYHVAIENLSRRVWAPAQVGSPRMTHWFYERARGQYADAQARELTPAKRRDFKLVNPTSQKFTKTDLAKFVNSWDQLPHLVSLGAEKNFREFTLRREKERKAQPGQGDFQELIGKAILYRQTERIVTQEKYGGYRANIVAYTVALLSHLLDGRLDFLGIWEAQGLGEGLQEEVRTLSGLVRDVILDAPGNGNVTEWSKKAACWDRVSRIEHAVTASVSRPMAMTARPGESMGDSILRAIISAGGGLSVDSLARRTSLDRRLLKEEIDELTDLGYLEKEGTGRSARFVITDTPLLSDLIAEFDR